MKPELYRVHQVRNHVRVQVLSIIFIFGNRFERHTFSTELKFVIKRNRPKGCAIQGKEREVNRRNSTTHIE